MFKFLKDRLEIGRLATIIDPNIESIKKLLNEVSEAGYPKELEFQRKVVIAAYIFRRGVANNIGGFPAETEAYLPSIKEGKMVYLYGTAIEIEDSIKEVASKVEVSPLVSQMVNGSDIYKLFESSLGKEFNRNCDLPNKRPY